MELPSHPDADDTPSDHKPERTVSWATLVVVALAAAVLALILILHLTGVVGPTAH